MSLPSLTSHNHTSFIASHALVLVLYASPWCAHRQRLLPTLAMAAASLPDNVRCCATRTLSLSLLLPLTPTHP